MEQCENCLASISDGVLVKVGKDSVGVVEIVWYASLCEECYGDLMEYVRSFKSEDGV